MTEVRANYDKSWKEALNEYLEDFLAFFPKRTEQLIGRKPLNHLIKNFKILRLQQKLEMAWLI